jgi:hypothetical protein
MNKEIEEARENLADNIPDKVRLKWTLRQLGKQESYIQELEDTNKALKRELRELMQLTKEERNNAKKDVLFKEQKAKIDQLRHDLSRCRNDYEYLLSKYNNVKVNPN